MVKCAGKDNSRVNEKEWKELRITAEGSGTILNMSTFKLKGFQK